MVGRSNESFGIQSKHNSSLKYLCPSPYAEW